VLREQTPIRYEKLPFDEYKSWGLYMLDMEITLDPVLRHVAPIRYCPYCGKELKQEEE